jgi:hypothetical protein
MLILNTKIEDGDRSTYHQLTILWVKKQDVRLFDKNVQAASTCYHSKVCGQVVRDNVAVPLSITTTLLDYWAA